VELSELIMLGACSILGNDAYDPYQEQAIKEAVQTAKRVWEEALRQEREEI